MRHLAWVVIAFALHAEDPKAPSVAKTEQEGTWRAVSFERDGKSTPEDVVKTITREVSGDHVVWKRDGKSFAGTSLTVDETGDPKTLDLIADGGPSRDKVAKGIYKLEEDELTICVADPGGSRPSEYSAPKGSRKTLMTFRRVAKSSAKSRKSSSEER